MFDHSDVQYSTVQYSTVQYSTVQYSTIQYNTLHPSPSSAVAGADDLCQTGGGESWGGPVKEDQGQAEVAAIEECVRAVL